MAKVAHIFGHPVDGRLHAPSKTWPIPDQLVGLEFEAEQVPSKYTAFKDLPLYKYYSIKEDGSLRDNGREFVLTNPLMGEDLSQALDLMKQVAGEFVLTERTGLHVHLDVRQLDQEQVYRLFLFYALFEHLLFDFVGDNRHASNFCIPWWRSHEQQSLMYKILTGKDPSDVFSKIEHASRYMALNINALVRFGSVEFRHMQNTMDFTKIQNWICIIMELKKAAEENKNLGKDFLREISSDGPIMFSQKYVPTLYKLMKDKGNFNQQFYNGLELCQEIVISSHPKLYFNSDSMNILRKYNGESEGSKLFLKNFKAQ